MKDTVASLIRNMIKENNHNTNISFPAVVVGTERLEDGLLDVKPVVRYSNSFTGETTDYPILREIPVVTPSTKNSSITFPIIQGDYVELLVQSVDIQKFVNGNGETHDPDIPAYGNLSNVIALVGFAPYQESPFNPNNYSNDFNNQDLNIVHNKNTGLESSVNISASGSILQKAPNAVTVDSPLFDVKSDLLNANNAVITTGGDVVVQGQSLNQFMLDAPLNLKGGDGDRGWSPVLAVENRGQEDAVLKITDWVGGEGDKPSEQGYIGSNGLVSDILAAINIRGARGKSGAALSADTIQEIVNDQFTTDRVIDLIQGQIDESALTDILTSKIAEIEVVKRDIAKEARERVYAISETAKQIEAETKQRVEDVRLLAEGQANIEGDALALVEAIDTERQERIDALVNIGEEISLEQQARIDDILDVKTKLSKETSDRIDSALAIDNKINKESLDRDIAIKEVDTKIDLEAKNRVDSILDLDGKVATERQERIADVLAANESIIEEQQARIADVLAANESIKGEQQARIADVLAANESIIEEQQARIADVLAANEGISTEITERKAEDSSIHGRIDTVVSKTDDNIAAIASEIEARTDADGALGKRIDTVVATSEENTAAITSEVEARADADSSLGKRIDTVTSVSKDNTAAIATEIEARTDADSSLSKRIDTVTSVSKDNTAAIQSEVEARTDADSSLSKRIDTVTSVSEDNTAAIQSEVEARTDADGALGKRIDTVVATSEENTAAITSEVEARADAFGSLATRIDTITSVSEDNAAAIQSEIEARTDEDISLGKRIDTVTSVSEDNTAAIKEETTARTDADTALSERIVSVVSESQNNTAAITEEISARTSADESLSDSIKIVSAKTDTNSSTITDVNTTLSNSIGAQAERISIIQADYKPNYADKEHFVDVNRSTQWTYAKTVAQDNYATNQRITTLQSEVQNSAATITQSLETIATKEDATSKLVSHVIAETETNKAAISDEQSARTTAFESLSGRIQTVQSTSEDNAAAVQEEVKARTSDIKSVSERIVTLTAETDENKAAILQESEARTSAVDSVSKSVTTLQAKAEENAVAISSEQQARADDISSVGKRIDSLITVTGENTAAITSEQLARTEEDSALASRIDIMSVEVGDNKAAIVEESEARTNDVESVSKRITTLVSQFDENKAAIDTEIVTLTDADIALTEKIDTLTAESDKSNALVISRLTALAEEDLALSGRIDVLVSETGENKAAIVFESTARTTEDEALSKRIESLVSVTEDNQAAVTKETEARTTALDAVAEEIYTLTAKTGENEAAVKEESRARTEEDSALSERIVTLTAETGENKAAIQKESEARTTDIESVTKDISTLVSRTKDNEAAITKESETRTTAFESLAKDIEVVSSKTDGNTASITALDETLTTELSAQAQTLKFLSSEVSLGYADKSKYADKSRATAWTFAKTLAHADYTNAQMTRGLTADFKDSSARFSENIELLSRQNEATATKTDVLSAQVLGNDYEGGGLGKLNSGLIFEESKARATDVEGLAEQISLLSAGVGEQFDSFEIWHFNKDKDGWIGGSFSGGWIDVETETLRSPEILDLDGAVYKHVKLRIKKFGQPTWSGLLTYVGGSETIKEPSYDEDGVALANWQLDWVGDITSFTLNLASVADAENYYSIDWIAVGRPSPGASNAALLRESKVRASETSANAEDLVRLDSQINGGTGVPIESSITRKLETTANVAKTTADKVDVLTSTYNEDMYAYEGVVQTTARTLAEATQAEAERLDLLSADVKPRYADASRYVNINRSTQWTYWKTIAADNYNSNQRVSELKSEFLDSNTNLTSELFTLAQADKAISSSVSQLSAKTDSNESLIQDLQYTITTPTTGLAAKVTELQASSSNNADEIKKAAEAAKAADDKAETALATLKDISEDDKLTPVEKKQLRLIIDEIKRDNAEIVANASKYDVSTALYTTAYDLLVNYVDDLLTDVNPTSNIVRGTFNRRFDNLYLRQAELNAAINTKTKDDINSAANAAKDAAEIAGNKGEVIYSSTEPATDKRKVQNLWIDTSGGRNTPKRWAGSSWLTVTDKAAIDAQEAADKANKQLLPENIATLVEGSGAFAGEFGAISGKFATMQGVVDGRKTAIETVSAVGNVEKLKNEVAKARLDKDVTNLNAQVTALDNAIVAYDKRVVELTAKRNAPKPPDISQEAYIALRASYQSQIEEVTLAKADAIAQKDVIADNVKQLSDEKAVLDSLVITERDVKAQHTIKIDAGGKIAGYGLVVQKDNYSAFDIRADRFTISPPANGIDNGKSPFMVLTTPTRIEGVLVPAGTYIRGSLLASGTITGDKIRSNTSITAPNIIGGNINIGDGNFTVNSDGSLYAESGTFKGTVLAEKISGTVDIESMKRSAWTPSYRVFVSNSFSTGTTPNSFTQRKYYGSHVSYGSVNAPSTGYGSQPIGSIMYEIDVHCSTSVLVEQSIEFVDDTVKIYVNGQLVKHENSRKYISYTLPEGYVTIQIININDRGTEIGLLLLGDFIDNKIVKFA